MAKVNPGLSNYAIGFPANRELARAPRRSALPLHGRLSAIDSHDNRRDRRFAINQNGKRRVVVIMRERGGRTLSFEFKTEDASVPTITRNVTRGSTIFADEAAHWDALHARFLTKRINHSEGYSDGDACTNQAESFFSRLRRA